MKKIYTFSILLCMMLLCSANVRAQVSSMADLFGKYKFTADVEVTEAGKASEANLVKVGEVVITKDAANIYDAQITGFAVNNGTEAMKVNNINTETCKFQVKNPSGNNYGAMGGLYYSDINGTYPFGDVQIESLVFQYDPETKAITCNDFSLVGNCDNSAGTCDVFAKFTNVKLTLIEAEAINIPDISGNWKVTGAGAWGTKEESVLPAEYLISLVQGATPKDYEATITIEGIAPFTLDATFDGNTLAIPFDNVLIDEANAYYIATMNGELTGKFTFNYSSEKAMPSGSPLVIVKKTDNEETPYETVQWWMDGSAKKQADAPDFSWAGTYKMTVGSLLDFTGGVDSFPAESDFEITYYEAIDAYYLTSIIGCNVGNVNNGGLKLTISDEDPTVAEISLTGPYDGAYLKSNDDNSVWYKMVDANGGQTPLTLKRNDDGTFTLSNFFIVKGAFGAESSYVASVQNITIQGEAPVVLTWEGSYEATATVTKYVDGDYPETFPIVIAPEGDYGQFITTFITEDAYAANYGGIRLTPSEDDADKADMASDKFVKTVEVGAKYWKIYDVNGSYSPISITRNEDGSLSIGSFSLFEISYDAEWNEVKKCLALYENVVATKLTTGVNSIVGETKTGTTYIYDLQGRAVKSGKGRLVIIKTADGVKKQFLK
ncbi:MAG: hypothetical protein PUD51_09295 [Prevotellaceae bacterium]|nr:hypothetical protein [Prevotellaceae bacterium]